MNRLACVAFLLLPLVASGFAPSRIGRVSSPIRAASTDDDKVEKAWRHVKKPLLRIGGKGVSKTHGNSLRQLLKDHTAVKVKINTDKYGSLEDAFSVLAKLAEEAGAPEGIEYLQSRASAKTVLLGMPGTLAKIEAGDFPPPPPPEYVPPTDDEEQLE